MTDTFDLRAAWESLSPEQRARLGMAVIARCTALFGYHLSCDIGASGDIISFSCVEHHAKEIMSPMVRALLPPGPVPMPDMGIFDE